LAEPRYQDLVATELPVRREPGATVLVYSGTSGQVAASAKNHVPVTMAEFRLDRPFVVNTEQQVREAYSDYQRAGSAPRKP
jgi:redox-sensitive bicupin YhaK (pirin superfamily)